MTDAQWKLRTVLETFVRDYDQEAVEVDVNGETVTSTQLHPYWVISGESLKDRPIREHLVTPPPNAAMEGRWVDALDLKSGDQVLLREAGPATIQSVRLVAANYPVYNFAVDDLKCYAVGSQRILVHNSCELEGYAQIAGQIDEIARRRSLGMDPASGLYRLLEEQAALRLEQKVGRLRRDLGYGGLD